MNVKFSFVFLACLSPLVAACGACAEDKLQSFAERWQLKFYPEELPDQRTLLTGTAWIKTGDMNILGASTDLVVRFPEGADPVQRLGVVPLGEGTTPVHFSWVSYPGFSNEPIIETTQKYHRSLLVGPCLEYGGQVRTLHVVQDRQLLLDAVVPVNPLQWYTVQVEFADADPIDRPRPNRPTRVKEFLYEFGADPLKVDEGPLTIHYLSRDSLREKTTIAHFHRTYRKEPPPKSTPGVRCISTGLRPLWFYPEFRVALTDEFHKSEAFLPMPQKPEQ